MKLVRTLLAAAMLALIAACGTNNPMGPEIEPREQAEYETSGNHGSGG